MTGIAVGAVASAAALVFFGFIADLIAGPGFDCGQECGSVPALVWAGIVLVALAGGVALGRAIARR